MRSDWGALMADANLSRRRLLQDTAGIAAAAAAMFMPPNVRRMLAQPRMRRSSFGDIKHVVILMQEDRSFDTTSEHWPASAGSPAALKLPAAAPCFTSRMSKTLTAT